MGRKQPRSIVQLDSIGKVKATYSSTYEAAKATRCDQSAINKCLNKHPNFISTKEIRWAYEDEHNPNQQEGIWLWSFTRLEEKLFEKIAENHSTDKRKLTADQVYSIYSFIEKKMLFICSALGAKQQIKVNDIAGKGIFKFRTYLAKVIGIDFQPIEKDWQQLLKFNKLRNFIIHSEGSRTVAMNNQDLISFLKSVKGVDIKENGEAITFHILTVDILIDFIAVANAILHFIYFEED
jgi:hypothetical protein